MTSPPSSSRSATPPCAQKESSIASDRNGRTAACFVASIGMRKAGIGQRARKRHEGDQSDGRDNDYHDDHFRVVETLARDQQCSGNIALSRTERHDSSRVGARSAKQPTNPEPYCDKQKSCKDCSGAEDL